VVCTMVDEPHATNTTSNRLSNGSKNRIIDSL
jgi:hypothetical protein